MSLLSGAAHLAGNVASPLANAAGAVTGINSLTDLGHNIGSGTATLSNIGGLFGGNNRAFTGSVLNYGGAYSGSPSTAYPTSTPFDSISSQLVPNSLYDGTTAAGGGGTAADNAGSQHDIAAYTDQINALNGLLSQQDTVRNNGTNSINRSFDNNNARLADQQNATNQGYDNQELDTTKGYSKTIDTINSNARNGYRSLQSLLGGTGSAGDILAPYAVSQQAGGQTNDARDGFAGNLAALATARKDAGKQYKNAQDDLLGQKNGKLQSLISSIDQQKQNYLSQIAQAQNQLSIAQGGSYATPTAINSQIQALTDEQNGLSSQYAEPQYQMQNVDAQRPDLSGYRAQAAQIGNASNQPVSDAQDPAAAFLAMLNKQKTNQFSF